MKKIFSILLVVMMLFGMSDSIRVFANDAEIENEISTMMLNGKLIRAIARISENKLNILPIYNQMLSSIETEAIK